MWYLKNGFRPPSSDTAHFSDSDAGTVQVEFFETSKEPLIALIIEFLTALSSTILFLPIFCYTIHIPQSFYMILSDFFFVLHICMQI